MEKGSYRGRRVDFNAYTASCFSPYLFSRPLDGFWGCGASALAFLTGVSPKLIAKVNGRADFSDRFMVRFLRSRHYRVQPLTLCNLSAGTGSVGRRHIVLVSQLFRENEGTWGVIYGGTYTHNFETYELGSLSLLSKPVLSAFLVIHPRWRLEENRLNRTPPKTRLKLSRRALIRPTPNPLGRE